MEDNVYKTLEAFVKAIQAKEIDASHLTAMIDNADFFVVDENGTKIVEAFNADALRYFFKLLGVKSEHV